MEFREFIQHYEVLFYLVTVICFVFGLKMLTSPKTARRGNLLSGIGMLVAIATALLSRGVVDYTTILIVFAVGSVIGAVLAYAIDLRAIPQMVAILNGFGGAVSALVGIAELNAVVGGAALAPGMSPQLFFAAVGVDTFIGTLTFWGSMIAFAKLQGLISEKAYTLPLKNVINSLLLAGIVALTVLLTLNSANATDPTNLVYLVVILVLASLLGLTLTMAVGGADMPIVIALFISYAGLSAGALGFTNLNYGLIMVGALVGASGLILTATMAKAINRNFWGIILGNITPPTMAVTGADDIYAGKIKSTNPEEFASILEAAQTVCIVPGYGLAVAQAQSNCRDLYQELTAAGKDVWFAVHPVAGRMPGHMNVLLAEVDIPYDKLKELDDSNTMLSDCDVAIILGANDVVNPLARTAKDTPIYGMPILDVDKAKTILVIKRSLSPGFSGIPNPLFILDQTLMIFKDAKPALAELVKAYREL
ncbi:MAG: NAD(P)(+) transhydrogenase (Re/Si-specific) subunit beta [Spirochaetales bacterium]